MDENATILIPDISGFTEFLSLTALDHGAHIINELLEIIVNSNSTDLQIAEIEGDAVIFYKKGKPVPKDELLDQCIAIFKNFHQHIHSIQQQGICHCNACNTSVNLGLKFIVHYGKVKELNVANFRKPSGLEIIIAHRLLKNRIEDKEYILMSDQYLLAVGEKKNPTLQWSKSYDEYPVIGRVNYEYALLDAIKKTIKPPVFDQPHSALLGEKVMSITINVSSEQLHIYLADPSAKLHYAEGLLKVKSSHLIPKVGTTHTCFFGDLTVDVTLANDIYARNKITITEQFSLPDSDHIVQVIYILEKLDAQISRLTVHFNKDLHPGIVAQLSPVFIKNMENLKRYAESSSETLLN